MPDVDLSVPAAAPHSRGHVRLITSPHTAERPPLADEALPESIVRRFEGVVRRVPERVAVAAARGPITYGELNRLSNRVASAILQRCGRRPGAAGLLLSKDASLVAGILGTLKADRFYLPLDPQHPTSRLLRLLEDADARLIITDGLHRTIASALARSLGVAVEVIAIDDPVVAGQPSDDLEHAPDADALAYLLYTSGSTGQPKAVMQTHRNVMQYAERHIRTLWIGAEDRLSLIASCTTGQAATDIYCALLSGATLCPVDVAQLGFDHLAGWLRRHEVTIYHSSASVFRSLLDTLRPHDAFPSVRVVKVGSEPVYRHDVERWRRRFPAPCVFVNALSMTEAGTVRQLIITHDTSIDGTMVPVGYPVDGVEVMLVGDDGELVPRGEPGEIVLRGRYLTPGYWRQRALTAAALRTDVEDPSCSRFSTGDRGRFTDTGHLEYLGRGDDQVKIRGFRVETAEVEAALVEHPEVRRAVVVARRPDDAPTSLVAYIVPVPGAALTSATLRAHLRTRMPEHMVPAAFVMLERLPLTASGKVAVQALPPPPFPDPRSGRVWVAPRTPTEWQLVGIWEDLLRVGSVGVQDDFFELGGNSLLAIQMLDRIERLCGVRVPLLEIVRGATIEHLATALLATETPKREAPLMVLCETGPRRPFIFLHGDFNGGGLYCHRLAQQWREDRPFVTIAPHAPDQPIPPTIEAMAADRVRVLREYQPRGPYVLGGYCNGGLVAYEMARQLEHAGHEVPLVVLLDASARNVKFAWLRRMVRAAGLVLGLEPVEEVAWFTAFRAMLVDIREHPGAAPRIVVRHGRAMMREVSGAEAPRALLPATADDPDAAYHRAGRRYRDVMDGYVPGRFGGRVVLLHSETMRQRSSRDPAAGWRRVARAVDLRCTPGEHQSCITEHLEDLMQHLSAVLRDAPV